eukprot:GGOE01018442.1.p1 GENE.GGOE01018442.1~~GGOE01018442.1.p1  ORF type:complete len:375 (-),score=61.67 GGOE01018442.1:257-1333(-)
MEAWATRFIRIALLLALATPLLFVGLKRLPSRPTQNVLTEEKRCVSRVRAILKANWDWDWTLRFYRQVPPQILSACDDFRYDGAGSMLRNVSFIFKSAPQYEESRLKAVAQTWGRHVSESMLVLAANRSQFRHRYFNVTTVHAGPWQHRQRRPRLHAGGDLSLVAEWFAFKLRPSFRWYFFHDDDTFVVLHRLLAMITYIERYWNPLRRRVVFGYVDIRGADDPVEGVYEDQPKTFKYGAEPFVMGGQGYLVSRAAMIHMDRRWLTCVPHGDADTCTSWCLRRHRVRLIHSYALRCERFKPDFWRSIPNMTLPEFHEACGPRVSFHAIYQPEEASTLYDRFYRAPIPRLPALHRAAWR